MPLVSFLTSSAVASIIAQYLMLIVSRLRLGCWHTCSENSHGDAMVQVLLACWWMKKQEHGEQGGKHTVPPSHGQPSKDYGWLSLQTWPSHHCVDVFFPHRASIVQKRIIYFQDEGSLTKKLCEQGKRLQVEREGPVKGELFQLEHGCRNSGNGALWVPLGSASSRSSDF